MNPWIAGIIGALIGAVAVTFALTLVQANDRRIRNEDFDTLLISIGQIEDQIKKIDTLEPGVNLAILQRGIFQFIRSRVEKIGFILRAL